MQQQQKITKKNKTSNNKKHIEFSFEIFKNRILPR